VPARSAFVVSANSLFRFSATALLGCALTPSCASFFLCCFSFRLCWTKRSSSLSCQTSLTCLQDLVFWLSDFPISRLPDLPIPAATPCPFSLRPSDCSAIRLSLH